MEEFIRNNQTLPENFTEKEVFSTVIELEAGNVEPALVSINSKNTSHTTMDSDVSQRELIAGYNSIAVPCHESDADSIGECRTFVKNNRYSRRELHSYRSAQPLDSDTNATGQWPTRPLDSDTNATGQKPSRVATKCDLVRLIHPLELAIVNEVEGDNECDTHMKVHKLKKTKKHKQDSVLGRPQDLKSIKKTHFENEFDESIPLLSMEEANIMDTTTSTVRFEKKKEDFPLLPFEGL